MLPTLLVVWPLDGIEVPLRSETVDVHEQARVAEEVVISKKAEQRTERVTHTVRKEEVFVDEDAAPTDETEGGSSLSRWGAPPHPLISTPRRSATTAGVISMKRMHPPRRERGSPPAFENRCVPSWHTFCGVYVH